MNKFLPYGKQCLDEEDVAIVIETLKSDFLTCGPRVEEFEKRFAEYVGAKHAVVMANATVALHISMLIAKVGPGDRVVTSPNTFLSSANCAAFVGATPDFCDIDQHTYNMDARALEAGWKDDTKAVVAVAYAGQSCDMPAIAKVARTHGAIVIEDGCHGTGGGFSYEGDSYKIGGHPWADMSIFSFHPVKTLTTGEGGILVTDHDGFAEEARLLRTHGVERDDKKFQGLGSDDPILEERGPWFYEMQSLGYNGRITDFQCALGLSQLKKLPDFIQRRRVIVAAYNEAFAKLDWLKTPKLLCKENVNEVSWHLYTVLIDFGKLGMTRTEVMKVLKENGIGTQVLYIPVYLQPWYRQEFNYGVGKCPEAEIYYRSCLSLPLFPLMTDGDIENVTQAVKKLKNG